MNNMIFAYIIFGISVIVALVIKASQNQDKQEDSGTLYKWGIETHDIETWRKRAMDNAKDKNTKSILKYSDSAQLLGLLYILYGWDLMPCK